MMLVQDTEGKSKVRARRGSDNQFLAGDIGELLRNTVVYIANLEFPNERGEGFSGPETKAFLERARRRTEKYWPELWANEPGQRPPDSMLRQMRRYLRDFWREPDERARDWHIHRAREFYQESRILHETRGERNAVSRAQTAKEALDKHAMLDIHICDLLDQPPPHTQFEDALFELQRRALIPSKRPLYCPNPTCKAPYFLSEKKGTKFCTPECFQAGGVRPSKRHSWHEHKHEWRKK